jgi:hypothetical protein
MPIVSVTVSINTLIEHFDQEHSFGKGGLPILLFYQSLNGHPVFETIDTFENMMNRINYLTELGRHPQAYVKIKIRDGKFDNSEQ